MTTKHKPATPLPFEACESVNGDDPAPFRIDGAPIARRGGYKCRVIAWVEDQNHADYLTHAANAYPRLVEALRRIRADATLDHHNNWCVDATIPEDGSLDSIESADALLRELGEAE